MMFQANQAVAQADQLQDSIETLNTDAADTESLIRDQVVMAERERLSFIFIFTAVFVVVVGVGGERSMLL